MLQQGEQFLLSIIQAYFELPATVSLFTFGPIAAILFLIQFQKQNKAVVPGIGAVLFAILTIIHFFNPALIVGKIQELRDFIAAPISQRSPIPLLESAFEFFIAPVAQRSIVEEGLFMGFLVYIIFVLYYLFTGKASGVLSNSSGIFGLKAKLARPQRSESNELGSGDLASPEQVLKWTTPSGDDCDTLLEVSDLRGSGGVTVAKTAKLHIPSGERNRHILAVAKTGSGKTTKLILPILYNDCMDPQRSTIVLDSKPEMWSKLAAMTRHYNPNKEIFLFNPLDTVRSLSWNILAKIESDTDCKLIANTIVQATDSPTSKSDSPFFRNNALSVLNAIMVGLLNDPNDLLSMPRVHELVQSGNKKLSEWLQKHPAAIRTTRTFCDLVKSGSQNADTIMSELGMRLAAWDLKDIRATTAFDELNLEHLVEKPTLFIVELRESELEMLRPMANVIVTEILRYLTKRAESCPGVTLPRPVSLVIDEFASALGRIPDIHVKLNTLRSRNVSIVAAVQSLAQINANYQDDAESVIAGFSTKIFIPQLDMSDAEWASKESGQMTVRFETRSTGHNRKLIEVFASKNDSSQEQVQQRAVLTPDEVMRPVDDIATFFMPNTPVFRGFLVPFYKIPIQLKRITEFDKEEYFLKLRKEPIQLEEKEQDFLPPTTGAPAAPAAPGAPAGQIPGTGLRPGITNTKGWDDDKVKSRLEEIKKGLEWDKTTGSARKWWLAFENENKHRPGLVLRLAEELQIRKATVTEFFLAYVYSNTDNIQANLSYLDYTRLKREEEKKKRAARADAAKAKENGETPTPAPPPPVPEHGTPQTQHTPGSAFAGQKAPSLSSGNKDDSKPAGNKAA